MNNHKNLAIFSLSLLMPFPLVAAPTTMCAFHVTDPDDRSFTQADLLGQVTILFYETREGSEKSRNLKASMNRSYNEQSPAIRSTIQRLGIIDAESTPSILRTFWRSAIREKSAKEQVPLYIDWNSAVGKDCGLAKPSGSALALIDRRGRLRKLFDGTTAQADSILGEIALLVTER